MDTPTLPDDELVLPHFEERLLAELTTQQRAGRWTAAAPTGLVRTNGARPDDPPLTDLGALEDEPSPRPRRIRHVAFAGVVGVAAAVAAAAFVVSGGDDEPDLGTGASTSTTEVPAVTGLEADILAATETASATMVVHTSDGTRESWVDATTHIERHRLPIAGGPGRQSDRGPSVVPSPEASDWPDGPVPTRIVDFCRREYADTDEPALTVGTGLSSITEGLRKGVLYVDGTESVDGRELLRVVATTDVEQLTAALGYDLTDEQLARLTVDPEGNSAGYDTTGLTEDEQSEMSEVVSVLAAELETSTYLVDPATNLPVLVRDGAGNTTTVEFLPRSSESLALLVPPVPEGFTQVPQIATDDVRYNLGCL